MGYPPRLFETGKWYHVYTRGQRREPLFFSPVDRIAYLSFLDAELFRRDGMIGSYCLMTNHVHLLIRMEETPLDEIFQTVHMKYAKYFNAKRDTVGHVFQGRPGMKMVLDESYLLPLVGYIHQNPVEAGMVDSVKEYAWSSWNWFVDDHIKDIAMGVLPAGFETRTKKTFEEVIQTEKPPSEGENYWGTKGEWDQMDRREEGREGRKYRERRNKVEKEVIVKNCLEGEEVTVQDLKSQSRNRDVSQLRHQAMNALYDEGYNPTEIGKYFNRTPASVSYARTTWQETQDE